MVPLDFKEIRVTQVSMAFLEIKEKRDLRENKDLEGQSLRREAVDQLVILESLVMMVSKATKEKKASLVLLDLLALLVILAHLDSRDQKDRKVWMEPLV